MERNKPKTELDKRLDDALMATFPCSDPFSFQTSTENSRQIPVTENEADMKRRPSSSKTPESESSS